MIIGSWVGWKSVHSRRDNTTPPAPAHVRLCVQLFFHETKVPLFLEAQKEIIIEASKQSDDADVIHLLGQAVALFPKSSQNIIKDLFLFLQKWVHAMLSGSASLGSWRVWHVACRVSEHMDTNRMSRTSAWFIQNICSVFQPCILICSSCNFALQPMHWLCASLHRYLIIRLKPLRFV